MSDKVFITGAAGFIGFHTTLRLIKEGYKVIGIDNLNSSYSIELKKSRLKMISNHDKYSSWEFYKNDLEDKNSLEEIFFKHKPKIVINLAAQAGVRNSIINPDSFISSNILGFHNILECCRKFAIENFIYASSSSVYGNKKKVPYSEKDCVDYPVSLYAATKKSNELMAHTYSELFKIPSTGLRFFTVYGPWGRPDMAPMIFAKNIFSREPIRVFNNGNLTRDFTYIDDVIETIFRLLSKPANKSSSNLIDESFSNFSCPHKIFNVGNGKEVNLLDFIRTLEQIIGIEAIKSFEAMQLGDVHKTLASTSLIKDWVGFVPRTDIRYGLQKFIDWYRDFYNL